MEPRDRVRGWRGRSSKAFVWLRFKQTRMEISDCGDPLHNRAWSIDETREEGGMGKSPGLPRSWR